MGPLVFKSAKDAFDYSCEFMENDMTAGNTLPALVERQATRKDGVQTLAIRVAGENGGTEVPYCMTLNADVPTFQVGDLAAYHIAQVNPALGASIFRFTGFVVAKLDPVFDFEKGWKIVR